MPNKFWIVPIFFFVISCFLVSPAVSFAQDEDVEKETKEEVTKETPAPVEEEKAEPASPLKPYWVNFMWRSSFGVNGGGLDLLYLDAPADFEDEFHATGVGPTDSHAISFWFYPTTGRHFMLTASIAYGSGRGDLEADDEESEFLEDKEYWYTSVYVPMGVGYRWLLGPADQVSLNLFFEIGWLATDLYLEGTSEAVKLSGGASSLNFGAHYRYHNGFLVGGMLEIRNASSTREGTTLADEDVDVAFDQSMFYLGVVIGYEPGLNWNYAY